MHCGDVWFYDQLPWSAAAAMSLKTFTALDVTANASDALYLSPEAQQFCLFSVIQSTTNVRASEVWSSWRDAHRHDEQWYLY